MFLGNLSVLLNYISFLVIFWWGGNRMEDGIKLIKFFDI